MIINSDFDPNDFLVSIVIPVFNEGTTIASIIDLVLETPFQKEIIVVDDGSTDTTARIVDQAATSHLFISRHFREKKEGETYFASNVRAIMEGYRSLEGDDFEFLAI